jgi:Zn-dependent protease
MGSGWWIADLWQQGRTIELASWIFWVIVSICLHELGHGVAALWEGDDTPRRTGHMTLNPMVHMGGMSIAAFLLIGFAWGLMPVNPYNFKHRRWGDAIVAAAGPLVNLILAAVLLTSAGLWVGRVSSRPDAAPWQINVGVFLLSGGWLNLVLLALNLLPFPPLDGSRIVASFWRGYAQLLMKPQAQFAGLAVFVILFWMTPLGGQFLGWVINLGHAYAAIIAGLVS